ncbi:MAG: ATP-dependent DNA helicase RecG [Pirellulaceae bacterium]|nr:ATP-dependent DNA helicase RecG [Pirellulaceae bacterium]
MQEISKEHDSNIDAAEQRDISLRTPLKFLPKVGANRAVLLEKLDVTRGIDLLFLFPRAYQEIAPTRRLHELEADLRCSVVGTIESIDFRGYDDGRSSLGALMAIEGGGFVRLVWYNQPYRRNTLARGMRLVTTGIVKSTGISWEIRHPEFEVLSEDDPLPVAKPLPIYPLTEGLQQRHVRDMVEVALKHLAPALTESVPDAFRAQHKLLAFHDALRKIHQPSTMEEANEARFRFIFQELLVYQLAISIRRHRLKHDRPAVALDATGQIHARILKRFAFELTTDQKLAIDDVANDMRQTIPMNRLIQGDVGSGKTVIAQYAMLLAVAHQHQAAFMAPTEILARQHARRLTESLAGSQCHVELLTGSMQGREKRELLERIALGTVDIVVGTQALLSEKVQFAQLGLVVIDEQHKFGVEQRASLCDSRIQPHYLVLSATPIPRTLTMTAMGDLDVSILKEKPPGRAPVHTYLGKHDQFESWWSFVSKQVSSGRQAYVIVPRVVGDDEEDIAGAEQVHQQLANGPFQGLKVQLLHGRLSGEEKASILDAFTNGSVQILVATTVVEVGIDVPNATVMTILDADRLGLAQLHQLRGRISRGTTPGYLCVFAKAGVSPEENARLSALASTDDGFRLAELDWSLRGPGNLLGTRQSGLPPFRIADLVRDSEIVKQTYDISAELINTDPQLATPEWSRVRSQVFGRHGDMLDLGTVG